MIPKVVHFCWFSNDPFPVEIKICLDSWKRIIPDFEIRRWTYEDARAIGCQYINEALDKRKWAFAADVVRFYALWKERGVYMDSDILLRKRFDKFIPEKGFATFIEGIVGQNVYKLQAAFLIGEKGNVFCKDMYDMYNSRHFILPDGTLDMTISPILMLDVAVRYGFKNEDCEQHLAPDIIVYPGHYVIPSKKSDKTLRTPESFALHTLYGNWRHRKLSRRLELLAKHIITWLRYYARFRR